VTQDYIGVTPAGNVAAPNGMGVFAVVSNGNTITQDVISGNTIYGITLDVSNNNMVTGNTIGLDATNAGPLPNGVAGLAVAGGSTGNQIASNTIAGNGSFGVIFADTGTTANKVFANTIGRANSGGPAANGVAGVVLVTGASGNTIGGATAAAANVISGNGLYGVFLAGAGTTNNTIAMNNIGMNAAGTVALANGDAGVVIQDAASGNMLVSNNIAGNTNANVRILGAGTTGNLLSGNLIGTDPAGSIQISSAVDGVDIESASGNVLNGNVIGGSRGVDLSGVGTTGNVLHGNRIGTNAAGTAPLTGSLGGDIGVLINNGAAGNLIGGNTRALGNLLSDGFEGIQAQFAGTGNVIDNNLIGTNLAGTAAIGQAFGIDLEAGSNGTQILNNLISGNIVHGVLIVDCNNTIVAGNFIGTDTSGSSAVANGSNGVSIRGTSAGNVIGGTTAAARNVISGNTNDGLHLADAGVTGNVVEGNDIGTAANGTSALGNGQRGVFVHLGAHDNIIGGMAAGAGNVIAFNGDDGVLIGRNSGENVVFNAGPGNAVLGNSIFSNTKIGIDLGPDDGVTANNSSGLVLNSPTLSAAAAIGNSVIVVGNWQANSFIAGVYRVEVFASPTASPSGHGEGKRFLGFATVFVNTNSNNFALVLSATVASGQVLSCTITDPLNNTSEFSTDVTMP
jgi:parallel beta-helix repeat protein